MNSDEDKTTLSYLYSKKGYRFLKILYILSFAGVILIANFLLFSNGIRTLNEKKTLINCNVGNHQTYSADDVLIYLPESSFEKTKFDYKRFFEKSDNKYIILTIIKKCYEGTEKKSFFDNPYDEQKGVEITEKYSLLGEEKTPEQTELIKKEFLEYKKLQDETEGPRLFTFSAPNTKYLDFSYEIFEIKPVFSYINILYYFLANLGVILVFEMIKRVFYYVILGKINPKKK